MCKQRRRLTFISPKGDRAKVARVLACLAKIIAIVNLSYTNARLTGAPENGHSVRAPLIVSGWLAGRLIARLHALA